MQTWDAVIVGAGVIGLSLARRLRLEGLRILLLDKGEPGRESSYAAGGMIASCDPHLPDALRALAFASAAMYPEFARQLQDESGVSPDLRDQGTIAYFGDGEYPVGKAVREIRADEISRLEPGIALSGPAYFLPERSVDPRTLCSALLKTAKSQGINVVTGSSVTHVEVQDGRTTGVKTMHSTYPAGVVVNCAGAWASQIQPLGLPARPAKGQIVCVIPAPEYTGGGPLVQHVVRTPEVYIIPRSDRRILLGATVEDAGFDKRTDATTIERLFKTATAVAPRIGDMRIHDAWAGLRPASPDGLPILGATSIRGYFAATGHFRDGIMLAPITAELMTRVILGKNSDFDLAPFSPLRFGSSTS